MVTDMRWLMRLNVLAIILYAFFGGGVLVADVWIFPKLELLTPPPTSVGIAIRQGNDIAVLRDISLVLFEHVSEQTKTFNGLLDSGIFWIRLHFLVALGLACINVVLLSRLRKSMR